MAQWKKIVTSGSNGLSISALDLTLGAASEGNVNLLESTTVQSAISQLNNVVGILAPSAPGGLSTITPTLTLDDDFSARNTSFNSISNVSTDTSPVATFSNFFDGDSGTLSASISTDGGSSFTEIGNITLTTETNIITDNKLAIISDQDANNVFSNINPGFYNILTAKVSPTGVTPNSVGNYDTTIIKLTHSTTGEATSSPFILTSNPATSVTNLNFTYNETNNFHYQSGIKYLGFNNVISAHYRVQIDSDANFINTGGRIAQIHDDPHTFTDQDFKIGTDVSSIWSPGQAFNITSSMPVADNRFTKGNVTLEGRNFKAHENVFNAVDDTKVIPNLLADSMTEDEITPTSGITRVNSGTGSFPTFGISTGQFGGTFNSATELTTSDKYELQFSSASYHWPPSTNYTSHIPSGPNYTGISGDSSNNNLRYVTFELGSISDAFGFTLNINNASGFDSSKIQTSDNFQLLVKVMNGSSDVTGWMDANAGYDTGDGDATIGNGTPCLDQGGVTGTSGNLTRIITFGSAPPKSGTVYVRVGWNSSAGTNVLSNSTRKFKYITKS